MAGRPSCQSGWVVFDRQRCHGYSCSSSVRDGAADSTVH